MPKSSDPFSPDYNVKTRAAAFILSGDKWDEEQGAAGRRSAFVITKLTRQCKNRPEECWIMPFEFGLSMLMQLKSILSSGNDIEASRENDEKEERAE